MANNVIQFLEHLDELFRLLGLYRVGGLPYDRAFKLMVDQAEQCIRIVENFLTAHDVARLCAHHDHARTFFDRLGTLAAPRPPEPPEPEYAI